MLLVILTEEKLFELFRKKEWQKANQKEFRVEEVIKRKRNKLYVKWEDYDKQNHEKFEHIC